MTATPQQARKEIFTRVQTCWTAGVPAIVGGGSELRFQGEEKPTKPGKSAFWGRASTQLVTTRQAAHHMPPEPNIPSKVVFETMGVVFVQVFAPMAVGAYAKGELIAEVVQRAFMAAETPSGVWFRNPRINELDNDGTWYRWNVIADFQFNQAKGA